MSYDLQVFVPHTAEGDAFVGLVGEGRGLAVSQVAAGQVTVVRGGRGRYAFSVEGPHDIDADDVPSEVDVAVLSVSYRYDILVEGSAAADIPHAVRFARRLARHCGGAVLDLQTDEMWAPAGTRTVERPQRESRIRAVDLGWYCLREDFAAEPAEVFIAAAERLLPEALPQRFGDYEPLRGKLAKVGASGFITAWREADWALFTSGSPPCTGGYLESGGDRGAREPFWSMSLTFLADPLEEPGWRSAVRRLFTALASDLPAFYATAEVTAGHIWSGRSLMSDSATEQRISPLRNERWLGLSPVPAWWTWFGAHYRDAAASLPQDRVTQYSSGLMYEASDSPRRGVELKALDQWVPADLFACVEPGYDGSELPIPLKQARHLPTALRP
ncbi:hypothetical protein ACOACO_03710 [Nocardioides sp. CPCC 205120]|uniref:hypothetical protein n=1 Tax=Nocardioides sp. CPCC 205120 TaxID=3406462 RepID=UPI003B51369C